MPAKYQPPKLWKLYPVPPNKRPGWWDALLVVVMIIVLLAGWVMLGMRGYTMP